MRRFCRNGSDRSQVFDPEEVGPIFERPLALQTHPFISTDSPLISTRGERNWYGKRRRKERRPGTHALSRSKSPTRLNKSHIPILNLLSCSIAKTQACCCFLARSTPRSNLFSLRALAGDDTEVACVSGGASVDGGEDELEIDGEGQREGYGVG